MSKPNIIKKIAGMSLVISSGVILSGLSTTSVYSTTLSVQAEYVVMANPDFGIPSNLSDNQTQTSDSTASIDIGASYGSGRGAVSASGYADNNGVIGTGVSGVEQRLNASASASSSTTITNNTAGDVHYFYTLNIPYSSVGMTANWFGNGDMFSASNAYNIDLNGTSIWSSFASVEMTSAGLLFETSQDIVPGNTVNMPWVTNSNGVQSVGQGYEGSGSMELSSYTMSLDLGVWGAGESLTLDYNLLSSIIVNAPASCGYECFSVSAMIGDPSGYDGIPVLGEIYAAVVPVPGTIWLLGSGLVGLIAVARRQRV